MDMSQTRLKQRQRLEPTQQRLNSDIKKRTQPYTCDGHRFCTAVHTAARRPQLVESAAACIFYANVMSALQGSHGLIDDGILEKTKARPGDAICRGRRIRHIQCLLARNLTFTQNANQRTLASVLFHQPASHYQYDTHFSHSATSNNSLYNHTLPHHHHTRSLTPALELPSGASSPTKSYFRSPWKSYYQGVQKAKGPGSDAGSITASESGRASSVIKEPIARLSAGIKATVFSIGHSVESDYTSESGSGSAAGTKKSRVQSRVSTDLSIARPSSNDVRRQQQQQSGEEQFFSGRLSRESSSDPSTPPPPPTPNRDKYLSPSNDIVLRSVKDPRGYSAGTNLREQSSHSDTEIETDFRLPPFASKSKGNSLPILLDSYFTLHEPTNDEVIYTSETVMDSNNPKYCPLEEHLFMDPTARRSSNVVVRIWASHRGSDYFPLLEWRVDLCCLRFIGKELRDLPTSLPNNTIIFEFENGFYTAPDDDDMADHPHVPQLEPIATMLGGGVSPSYTYESVMRLNNLHECIADTKKSRDEIKLNIEVALNKENAPMLMQKRRGECTERLWHLQRQVGHELNVLEEAQDRVVTLRREHALRRKALAESKERGQTQEMYLEENLSNLANNKESLFHVLKEYSTVRMEMIATLFTIFPVTESETDPSLLKICNVPLPNSVYVGVDEEAVAVGLGFACHLVVMLAHYLCVPLRYPLTPMGSRALVLDPVSLLVGPKIFPLYAKGQDAHRFDYGVFLLNKDVEQLVNSQGLQLMDLRKTLPNLRHLMETLLTSSPSQSTLYRSKVVSRKRQDRQEQERLNDLFVISLEQREFDHILNPRLQINTTSDDSQDQTEAGRRLHERSPSTTKANTTSERSALVREYDPIDGDYLLILDNASTKSPMSRNESNSSEASTVERVEPQPRCVESEPQHLQAIQQLQPQLQPPPSQQQQPQQQQEQSELVDDVVPSLNGTRSLKSTETVVANTNQRGRRLSDKFAAGSRDGDREASG
ncbi:UV radiation resistance protein and autophagy-related subunit 14-domain-containing protein [Dissophora ornata]|nr:UV radiation resistance protein and autophagy-related subunit 14-domain-containing protein [Dissophora ornata]